MNLHRTLFLISILVLPQAAFGQISPGKLSAAHEQLEGIANCAQCHESGKEISGTRCLTCHGEIKKQLERKSGFHFSNSSSSCITCHKEHLGKDARITKFDEREFDHAKTGFALAGKHATLKCEQCHDPKNIRSDEVRKGLARFPHKTFLGLESRCVSCHEDRHRGTLGVACESCHGMQSWTPATGFNHTKTKFALSGGHAPVPCVRCHTAAANKGSNQPVLFNARPSTDCTPCHTNPHGTRFADKSCRSCHTTEGWKVVRSFNHGVTRFPLIGKHTTVACSKCHGGMGPKGAKSVSFTTKDFKDCAPCHASPHRQNLAERACSTCHTPSAWSDKAAAGFDHSLTRFILEGRHTSVKCEACHKTAGRPSFAQRYFIQFDRCIDCHADYHRGQFEKRFGSDCARCHSVQGFKPSAFTAALHAGTRFPLTGGHTAVPCAGCHSVRNVGGSMLVQYEGTSLDCESCHRDPHAGQFAAGGVTLCASCHTASAWRSLIFNHETQSAFRLTGAHRNVPCGKCHLQEQIEARKVTRFKPLASTCESCHKGGQ